MRKKELKKRILAAVCVTALALMQAFIIAPAAGQSDVNGASPAGTDLEVRVQYYGERGDKLFCIQDTACAADHMLLMAAELGLDGCFVGAFDEDNCRKYLNIPANQRPVIILPIGYASAEFPKKPRKNIDGVVTFVGKNKPVFDEQNGTPFRLYDRNLPGAVFEKLNLSGAVIKNCNLQDVQIEDCDVSNMTLNGAPINK